MSERSDAMKEINLVKLQAELAAAGLPVCSVHADGRLDYAVKPTAEQVSAAEALLAAHDPSDALEEFYKSLAGAGFDLRRVVYALWLSAAGGDDSLLAEVKERLVGDVPVG